MRVDSIGDTAELAPLIEASPLPCLLTLRHPAEGGAGSVLSPVEREGRLAPLLAPAAAVDIEIASAPEMAGAIGAAKAAGTLVVLSFHDFDKTPDIETLREKVRIGIDLGADVVKLATQTNSFRAVSNLVGLLDGASHPLAVMGMGQLGMASRLLAAQCGSVLNYASAGAAKVEGQWPAAEFRSLLERVGRR